MKANILKLKGTEKEVYTTIGPIAMSELGRKYFDNYPVITTEDHVWYVLKKENQVCAFAAVVPLKGVFAVRNLFIHPDCAKVQSFEELMNGIMDEFKESEYDQASAFVKEDDKKYWQRFGFEPTGNNRGKWGTMQKTK